MNPRRTSQSPGVASERTLQRPLRIPLRGRYSSESAPGVLWDFQSVRSLLQSPPCTRKRTNGSIFTHAPPPPNVTSKLRSCSRSPLCGGIRLFSVLDVTRRSAFLKYAFREVTFGFCKRYRARGNPPSGPWGGTCRMKTPRKAFNSKPKSGTESSKSDPISRS